jgi:hypothetical protein
LKRKHFRLAIKLLLDLLNPDARNQLIQAMTTWDVSIWQMLQKVCLGQGLAAYLYFELSSDPIFLYLPEHFRQCLEIQYLGNQSRSKRLQEELSEILHRSSISGIQVMPLKGSLLAHRFYSVPWLRPMADIDLLIQPAEYQGLADILKGLGYHLQPSAGYYANHDTYLQPGGNLVVARDIEHPDNPRPVEVHIKLNRPLWGNVAAIDLTDLLWDGSLVGEISGQKAIIPRNLNLIVYLAFHTIQHLAMNTGRIIRFLDLALTSNKVADFTNLIYPSRVYMVLRLAERIFPHYFRETDYSVIAQDAHPRLRRWSKTVALDDRCGLVIDVSSMGRNRLRLYWERWNPSAWRLTVGYEHLPLPLAYLVHVYSMFAHIIRKSTYKY